ncbi:MAG: PIN domain-containing protein [Candidatus Sericytochromatia bacterium]
MRSNVVLIDFESVQPDSIEALNQEHFQVLLFCGAHQTKVPFEIAMTLQKLGARAQYVKISGTGPNALDFHIAYYIGKLTAEQPGTFFHIVSRDKGFDPLIQHLKAQKILALRSESIPQIPIIKNGTQKPPAERAAAFIATLKKPKVSKPRTEKTMSSAIKAHFQPGVEDSEVVKILKAMVATGFISIEAGKVVYAPPIQT